jgi:Ca2+-binding EF-hand superfamily protein
MSKFLLAAAFAVSSTAMFAQTSPLGGQPAVSGRIELRSDVAARTAQLFAMLDTNHDGVLDQAEIDAAGSRFGGEQGNPAAAPAPRMPLDRNAVFDMIDTNHDGMISRDEFARAPNPGSAAMKGGRGGGRRGGGGYAGMARAMMAADTDHDGKVTLKEATAFVLERFDRRDLNHDGQVTPEEKAAYRAQRQQMREQ